MNANQVEMWLAMLRTRTEGFPRTMEVAMAHLLAAVGSVPGRDDETADGDGFRYERGELMRVLQEWQESLDAGTGDTDQMRGPGGGLVQ